ncbi:MAG TPA: sugar phosphate nucleotidyltransferase [Verrucomicrobiae bacterium]|nr:sugar phosphate nucleotidyltransferase [Verrucomicrobiae bacterium]
MKQIGPEDVTAVVLAGGFGTRIKHLLGDLPKPMVPVCGKPFIDWVVRYLAEQNVRRVILSTGYMAQTIHDHFQSQAVNDVQVTCVPESTPLGTAGGFLHAIHGACHLASAWLVLNGDSLSLVSLKDLFRSLNKFECAISGVSVSDASRFGKILVNAKGELKAFMEKEPGSGVINAGVYLFRAPLVEQFPRQTPLSFETDVFPTLLSCGVRIKVCVTEAPFLDIGTPDSLPQAEDFVQRHREFFEA